MKQQEAIRAKQQEQLRARQQEIEAEQKKDRERLESRRRTSSKRNWKNISSEFTDELQNQREDLGFSYEQAQDWINTGFKAGDAEFVAWLQQNGLEQDTVLNSLSSDDLNQLYQNFESEKRESGTRRKPKDKDKNGEGKREN